MSRKKKQEDKPTESERPQAEKKQLPPAEQAEQGKTAQTPAPLIPGSPPPVPETLTPKPYEEVITEEAVTQVGLFTVHRVGTKYYFELAPEVLNKDLIWYAEFAADLHRLAAGNNYLLALSQSSQCNEYS